MVEIAAHLVDHVIPRVPVRQWVLSLPKRLRGFLHRDPPLAGKVLRIFLEEVERALRRRYPGAGAKARTGEVVFPHRFGASLNAHYHFHACVIDGLYEAGGEDVRFHKIAELRDAAIVQVQARVRRRVLKAFVRWGLEADARDEMLGWQHGGGFSLDASVRIEADDREGLERLLRYCARPPLAAGHLQWVDARHEQLRYHLPKPLADGTAELVVPALELLERLSAFIPPPRIHRHRYFGVLAPNAPRSPRWPPSRRSPIRTRPRPHAHATRPQGQRASHRHLTRSRAGPQSTSGRCCWHASTSCSLSRMLSLWGRDGDYRLHHRSAHRAGDSHPHRRAVRSAADLSLPRTARMGNARPNGRIRSDPSRTGV
jgi:hypothetical protein